MCSLTAGVSQRGFGRCLHGRLRAILLQVGEFLYCLWGVCGPWQCVRAVVKGAVEVIVPRRLCLLHPGLRGFRCFCTVVGP